MTFSFGTLFRQALVLLVLAALAAVPTALLHPRQPSWREDALGPGEVRLQTALQWEHAVWLDARSRADYEQDHIPDALLLNEDEWESLFFDFLGQWDPDQKIVVYCGGARCQASTQVAARLRIELGTDEVYVLKGGWSEWLRHK